MSKDEEIMAMEVSTHEGKALSDMYRWAGPNGEVVYVFGDGTRSDLVQVKDRRPKSANWPYELSEAK